MRQVLVLATVLLTCAIANIGSTVQSGEPAPPWSAADLDGTIVEFPSVADGAPTVLLFWATWCPYCKAFIPELESIQQDYAAAGVGVLGINMNEDGDVTAYIDSLGFPLRTIPDGDPIAAAYNVQFTPGIMVVDGQGTVIYRRASTDRPPGQALAEFWAGQVRAALDAAL